MTFTTIKNWLFTHANDILIAVCAVLAPFTGLFISVLCLIGFDFITGIWAAKKRSEEITSKRMRDTLNKIVFYNIALLTGIVIMIVIGDAVPVARIIAGVVAMIEGKSVLENVTTITGTDFVTKMLGVFKR